MKQKMQSKEYETPEFQLVRQDEQEKVFFAFSGSSPATTYDTGSTTSW